MQPISDFVQIEPEEGQAATERTEVWIALDRTWAVENPDYLGQTRSFIAPTSLLLRPHQVRHVLVILLADVLDKLVVGRHQFRYERSLERLRIRARISDEVLDL